MAGYFAIAGEVCAPFRVISSPIWRVSRELSQHAPTEQHTFKVEISTQPRSDWNANARAHGPCKPWVRAHSISGIRISFYWHDRPRLLPVGVIFQPKVADVEESKAGIVADLKLINLCGFYAHGAIPCRNGFRSAERQATACWSFR